MNNSTKALAKSNQKINDLPNFMNNLMQKSVTIQNSKKQTKESDEKDYLVLISNLKKSSAEELLKIKEKYDYKINIKDNEIFSLRKKISESIIKNNQKFDVLKNEMVKIYKLTK